jgi:copper chaperone NosL
MGLFNTDKDTKNILKKCQDNHQNKPPQNNLYHNHYIPPAFLSLLIVPLLLLSLASPLIAEAMKPGPRDRCPVCGMFVAPYPAWVAQIAFNNGSREFFDGPKDMFRYYLQLPKDSSDHGRDNVNVIYVTEYYSTKLVQADKLFFVSGSDIHGPMGHELIPLHSRETAETFKRDHMGSDILTFDQVTSDILSGN